MAKKEDLLEYTFYNKKLVNAISEYLGEHGLRLGMTEEELYDYMDEAYLEGKAFEQVEAKKKAEQVRLDAEKKTELERRIKKEETDNDKKIMIAIFLMSFTGTLSATTLMLWIDILIGLFI